MNSLILSCFTLLVFASAANGIACIVCTTTSTSSCGDPYSAGTSLSMSSGFIGCYKLKYSASYGAVSAGYVDRGGYMSGQTCTAGNNGAGASYYCCSDKDNCNGAMGLTISVFATMSLIMSSLLAKRMFFS